MGVLQHAAERRDGAVALGGRAGRHAQRLAIVLDHLQGLLGVGVIDGLELAHQHGHLFDAIVAVLDLVRLAVAIQPAGFSVLGEVEVHAVRVGRQLVALAEFQGQLVGLLFGAVADERGGQNQPRALLIGQHVGLGGIGFDAAAQQRQLLPERFGGGLGEVARGGSQQHQHQPAPAKVAHGMSSVDEEGNGRTGAWPARNRQPRTRFDAPFGSLELPRLFPRLEEERGGP
jgi:hypothetical protein